MLSGLEKAAALEAAGQYREAITEARAWLSANPGDPAATAMLARLALRLGRHDTAIGLASEVLKGMPGNVDALAVMAHALRRAGHTDKAEEWFHDLLAVHPNDLAALNEMGNITMGDDRPVEAVGYFRKALTVAPGNPLVMSNLALALGHAGQREEALRLLDELLRRPDAPAEAFDNRASLLTIEKNMDAALAAQDEGISRYPERARGYLLRARLKSMLGRTDEALEDFRQCVRLDPDNREAAFILANSGEGEAPPTPPDSYVAGLFDYYAEFFDWHLKDRLGYCGHELVRDSVRETLGTGKGTLDTVDIGCGTGLCAMEIAPWAAVIDGMDLAPKMVRYAAKRGIYRELAAESAVTFLNARPARYDLAVAADVMGYVGDPVPILNAVAASLKPGGHYCFTAELAEIERFGIGGHMRYVYEAEYLIAVAAEAGFETLSRREATMRRDGDEEIRVEVLMMRFAG